MTSLIQRRMAGRRVRPAAVAAQSPPDAAEVEELDEMVARQARFAGATWAAADLEDGTSYIWQPETLCYHDVTYGTETWRMSNTPGLETIYHSDIGVPVWSADGAKIAFTGYNRVTQAYDSGQQASFNYIFFTVDANGLNMRPTVEAKRRRGREYFHWCPQIPGIYYQVGETALGAGGDSTKLYRSTVASNGVVSPSEIATIPIAACDLWKMVSSDGRRLILLKEGTPSGIVPVTIDSAGSATVDDADGYAVDRDWGLYGDMGAGPYTSFHDQYISGLGDWFFAMPSGTATWWRQQTTGSDSDGGPLYSGDDMGDFGEVWPENHNATSGGNTTSPFVQTTPYTASKSAYWSHFMPDRWGRCAIFSNVSDNIPTYGVGTGIWDYQNHAYVIPSFGGKSQHHAWSGFTDWVASSGGDLVGNAAPLLYVANITDQSSRVTLNNMHPRYFNTGSTQYNPVSRPAQSPDGTKVAWHSEFLNAEDKADIYWSVAMYPFPPTDLEAETGAGEEVALSFLPPTYTSRKWINSGTGEIDEEAGETLYAREVKSYQIWRSANGTSGWTLVGEVTAEYANVTATNTLTPYFDSSPVSGGNKIVYEESPGDGTHYYAITTREHSGLESRILSEVIEVTVSSGLVTATAIDSAEGQEDFWTTAPTQPTNLSVSAGGASGQNVITWDEPEDTKVRYYNLYYSLSGGPWALQHMRFASVAAGTSTFTDVFADYTFANYGITSVDFQGNESAIVTE